MIERMLFYIICSVLLVSCSTQYQQQESMQAGYTESKTSCNKFIVSFRGNNLTSNDRVMKYALLRASEVALDHGFSYFKVEKKENIAKGVVSEVINDQSVVNEKTRRSEMEEEKGSGVRLYIKCFKKDPMQFDVINVKEYIERNKKY